MQQATRRIVDKDFRLQSRKKLKETLVGSRAEHTSLPEETEISKGCRV